VAELVDGGEAEAALEVRNVTGHRLDVDPDRQPQLGQVGRRRGRSPRSTPVPSRFRAGSRAGPWPGRVAPRASAPVESTPVVPELDRDTPIPRYRSPAHEIGQAPAGSTHTGPADRTGPSEVQVSAVAPDGTMSRHSYRSLRSGLAMSPQAKRGEWRARPAVGWRASSQAPGQTDGERHRRTACAWEKSRSSSSSVMKRDSRVVRPHVQLARAGRR
jgi:hypothetical protein